MNINDITAGEALRIVELETQFSAAACFWLQVWVADQRQCALSSESIDTWRQLFYARSFVAFADTTFNRPERVRLPRTVNAWAEVAAEFAVVVITASQGQLEAVGQAPFVLGKQCVLLKIPLASGRATIDHFHLHVLAT